MSDAHLLALGLSHKTAPVEQREKATLAAAEAREALRRLLADRSVDEAVALSTCNRTEIYAATGDPGAAERAMRGAIVEHSSISDEELGCASYSLRDERAVRQLFRVASSLDSMVVGESEIQGQVKNAWELAAEEGASGPLLNRLFQQALEVGKRVRTDTLITTGPTSVPAVAVDMACRATSPGARVLVIGAGSMAETTARSLAARDIDNITIANRTPGGAHRLANDVGGQAVGFDALGQELTRADVVISATDAPHVILGRDPVREALESRPGQRMVIIDISVPRDIDHSVSELPGAALYDIDDLERVVEASLNGRRLEAERGEALVDQAVRIFGDWRAGLAAAPAVRALRERAEEIRLAELARSAAQLDRLSPEDRERVDALTRGIVQKILHQPTVRLTEAARRGDGVRHVETLLDLFDLPPNDRP